MSRLSLTCGVIVSSALLSLACAGAAESLIDVNYRALIGRADLTYDRPDTIDIDLRMLRYQMQRVTGKNHELAQQHAVPFRKAEHTATSRLHVRNQDIVLTQVYEENDYYSTSVFWDRYLFTMDRGWLRDRAYPMIKDTAEFYRHFPNFKKNAQGTYHLRHVNDNESGWNSSDTPLEIATMYVIFPLAIRASEILDVDAELRPVWQEIIEHLPPLAGRDAGPEVRRQRLRTGYSRGGIHAAFVYGGPGTIKPVGSEPGLKQPFLGFKALNSFIDSKGIGGARIFRNRLRLRESPGAIDAEHIGGLTMGIHGSLLASAGPEAHSDPVLEVFKEWPKSWDAAFTLRARGAFVVSSMRQDGKVLLVEIRSEAGSICRLVNPWPGRTVELHRQDHTAENLSGSLLTFPTVAGNTITLYPKGTRPSSKEIL